MTEDTNKLIKEAAYDIISITTLWGLVSASHLSLDRCHFFAESKYIKFSSSFQDITKLVAMGCSVLVISKYFRS
jgi:hypothetical protein